MTSHAALSMLIPLIQKPQVAIPGQERIYIHTDPHVHSTSLYFPTIRVLMPRTRFSRSKLSRCHLANGAIAPLSHAGRNDID